jgi:hypothetical protein
MANRQRGYVDIQLDKARRLCFDFNAICELEDVMGKPVTQLQENNVGFKEIRALLWAGLLHEDRDLTIEEAGALIDEAESVQYVTEKVVEAFTLGLGLREGDEKGKTRKGARASIGAK